VVVQSSRTGLQGAGHGIYPFRLQPSGRRCMAGMPEDNKAVYRLGAALPPQSLINASAAVLPTGECCHVIYPVFQGAGGHDAQCRPVFPISRFREELLSDAASSHSIRPT
jgi:hypothetical protein